MLQIQSLGQKGAETVFNTDDHDAMRGMYCEILMFLPTHDPDKRAMYGVMRTLHPIQWICSWL